MEDEAKTTPTWGYHKTKEPKIFDLKDGESLPRGWADVPHQKPEDADDAEAETPAADPVTMPATDAD
ncbi:hypothetical protein KUL72_20800 [Bradyrhizobium arachidis]|uniref:hypothetical protein n=1 Tax=Bradyrhizobium arachidis TaxID=858423 RepID=UPI0021638B6A|nr:hypothetical protein [Bradyrhizobium arachidis]UVO33956.1 hypothetical protein KUL72_20800 [Bradyrhizobium arachidis]